ncbi:MAG: cation-translocating P-type ATPase [Burkholderiales bacterium]|nr:cation-translocating P-type ATPase [Burkholderiales bacterium]
MIQSTETTGLSGAEATRRLAADGPNELGDTHRRALGATVVEVVREPMFLLLIAAGVVYFLIGDRFEAMVLTGFVLVIMAITIFQQRRTDNALAALRDMSSPRALVMRDGVMQRIAGREVVRGDLLMLQEGDRVPADGELLSAHDLAIDESMLTGESLPLPKSKAHAVYAGTLVTQGQGTVEVSATGSHTEMGRIGKSLDKIDLPSSPLRDEITRLTQRIAAVGAVLALILVALYWVARDNLPEAVLAGIALAMSLLPQEFPVIMIIFFAFAARRLGKLDVLTRRLDAIETLGETSVLCVDKTGTLTKNQMQVVALHAADASDLAQSEVGTTLSMTQQTLLQHALLASEITPHDAMEKAIHQLVNLPAHVSLRTATDWTLAHEYELSPQLPAMTHVWHTGERYLVAIKGAPELVAAMCHLPEEQRTRVANDVGQFAERGLRVLGVARANHLNDQAWPVSPRGFEFEWLGSTAFADPLREEVPAAIAQCQGAGIRIVMITGDHPRTALAIAHAAGIPTARVMLGSDLEQMDIATLTAAARDVNVFARVKPHQKLALVEALKQAGEIVAMTGDGVNDAPALKAAHIGVAMGQRGTDVAREASALVLLRDDFDSIVQAIRTGRRTFANMRQAMIYTLAVHIPIVGLSILPVIFGLPLLLTPLHIAFLELVIDPACSIVFEAENGDETLMQQAPRRTSEPLLSLPDAMQSIGFGTLTTVVCFAAYYVLLQADQPVRAAATLVFVLLVVANTALILPSRSRQHSWRALWQGLPGVSLAVICATLAGLWLVTQVAAVAVAFRFTPLPAEYWLLGLLAGLLMLPLFQLIKLRRSMH